MPSQLLNVPKAPTHRRNLLGGIGDEGPLLLMLHGFPDYWYTWRLQMEALHPNYRVVAMDLRGYNLSDAPKGVENYQMKHLIMSGFQK